MNKARLLITGIVIGIALALGVQALAPLAASTVVLAQGGGGDDNTTLDLGAVIEAPMETAAVAAGAALVYFTPQDSNETGTVIFLYNTSDAAVTAIIRSYALNGTAMGSWSVPLDARQMKRLVSDAVDSPTALPPSWTTPAATSVNFTDSSAYATMELPPGVKADGYVLYNPDGHINPNLDQGAVPLRFSSDPSTIFLPTVVR